jgi:flagellar basal-body rod modification protein FlgD
MIDPVTSTSAAAAATPAAKSNAVTQDEFLRLFVAQLQHQDPLSPLEPNELTSQLAQFSSLEQLTSMNARLDALTATTKESGGPALLGLIGREVTIDGSRLSLTGGETVPVTYTLAEGAQAVTATIRAADGTVVRQVDLGSKGTGSHTFEFDGKATNGSVLPDGVYRLEVSAAATKGATPTSLALTAQAMIDGVDLAADPPVLIAGDLRISLDQVREVHATQ